MSDISPLETHRRERADLLALAVRLLEADERIVAAWLHGSMGRGTQDDWSDIDLFIVVADEQMEVVAAERAAFVSRAGQPLLTVEAPQNAPPGGAYLLAMYPGTYGPHILDCSWQPRSQARRPSDTRLLFDRVGIPPAEEPLASSHDERLELAKASDGLLLDDGNNRWQVYSSPRIVGGVGTAALRVGCDGAGGVAGG